MTDVEDHTGHGGICGLAECTTAHERDKAQARAIKPVDASQIEFTVCQLCQTPLVLKYPDGKKMTYTAHTVESCNLLTLDRIKTLMKIVEGEKVRAEAHKLAAVQSARLLESARRYAEEWLKRAKDLRTLIDQRDPAWGFAVQLANDIESIVEVGL